MTLPRTYSFLEWLTDWVVGELFGRWLEYKLDFIRVQDAPGNVDVVAQGTC